jgi:hypothetical protein
MISSLSESQSHDLITLIVSCHSLAWSLPIQISCTSSRAGESRNREAELQRAVDTITLVKWEVTRPVVRHLHSSTLRPTQYAARRSLLSHDSQYSRHFRQSSFRQLSTRWHDHTPQSLTPWLASRRPSLIKMEFDAFFWLFIFEVLLIAQQDWNGKWQKITRLIFFRTELRVFFDFFLPESPKLRLILC